MTLWDPMNCSMPGLSVLHCLLEFAQTHVDWVSDAIQPSHPLLPLLLLPSIFLIIRVFSGVGFLHPVALQLQNQSLQWVITVHSFRTDWLDLQGTLKSLLQHHSSKASILQHSAFFIVQISHPYMTTGKTIALTRWTFVGKVMSLLFNTLSRFVIAVLPRSNCLLISWLQWFWSPRK